MNTMMKELKTRGYSKETMKAYEFHNYAFLKLIEKSAKDVTKSDIKDYINIMVIKGVERPVINLVINAFKFYYQDIINQPSQANRQSSHSKADESGGYAYCANYPLTASL